MNAPRTETIIRKRGEIRDHALYELARELEDENGKYNETLHDGFAVYSAITDDAKRYTTPENVSAVLDAFKRAKANKVLGRSEKCDK